MNSENADRAYTDADQGSPTSITTQRTDRRSARGAYQSTATGPRASGLHVDIVVFYGRGRLGKQGDRDCGAEGSCDRTPYRRMYLLAFLPLTIAYGLSMQRPRVARLSDPALLLARRGTV